MLSVHVSVYTVRVAEQSSHQAMAVLFDASTKAA